MGSKSTGSREHWAKKTREQVAEDSRHCINESNSIIRFFLLLASLGCFSDTYFAFRHQYITYFNLSPLSNIPLIQGANETNFREQGDGKNNLGSTQS